ncbi:hypothetical protein DSO57_1021717 [Entomophthora muscae]|uniref:Uncharacterized protein n=1 Tax=Entomophthora muscae TaxID=34485 RepID=A0ACC2UCA1_9FUNG|nr:hypothetical protein DSO57_1021717 [Entomophthora muscae]
MRQRLIQTLATQNIRSRLVRPAPAPLSIENQLTQKLASSLVNGDLIQAKQEFRWMLDHLCTNSKHATPSTGIDFLKANPTIAEKIGEYIKERTENHKPLQYILGTQPFGELDLIVRQPVLIPRWETEEWSLNLCTMLNNIDLMTKVERRKLRILDIGTGSGCIALLLASKLPKGRVEVFGIDQSQVALELALENKARNKGLLQNPVQFSKLDIMDDNAVRSFVQAHGYVDMIVSNPPYITPSEYAELSPDVKNWEDPCALVTEDGLGLQFYRRIIELSVASESPLLHSTAPQNASSMLPLYAQVPQLVLEVGSHQQATLVSKLSDDYFKHSRILKDLAGQDRVVIAYQSDISL